MENAAELQHIVQQQQQPQQQQQIWLFLCDAMQSPNHSTQPDGQVDWAWHTVGPYIIHNFAGAANKVVFQRVKQQKQFRKLLPKST